jgi:catechol 2,3-dioxygenase-like lactoylglutathione lyase family enzyme
MWDCLYRTWSKPWSSIAIWGLKKPFLPSTREAGWCLCSKKAWSLKCTSRKKTAGIPGAVEHLALGVKDIEKTFELAKAQGWKVLDNAIQFLPFWEHGVKFFTIVGPNGEKIEFSQMLS